MTTKLLNTYRSDISELDLVPSGGGAFEVTVNGKQVYSKKQTGKFPNEEELVGSLKTMAVPAAAKG